MSSAGLALAVAGPLAAWAVDTSPGEILADPDRFDQQPVTVSGTIADLRELGSAYVTFDLSDGERTIRVSWFGTPSCPGGATVTVEGVFQKVKREGYKIYSEVEAKRVTCR